MPIYFAINPIDTASHATPGTETDYLRLLTVANQKPCRVMALFGGGKSATAGGHTLRLASFGTPSTSGSAFTPAPRLRGQTACSTTAFTAPTVGTTRTPHLSIGFPQIGGTGGWFAIEPDAGVYLSPNGGANGNLDVLGNAQSASQTFDYTLEFTEG